MEVQLNPVLKLSNFVGATVNTGGGKNSLLFSLRNAWGECKGVVGGLFSPSSKGSSFISGKGITGRNGSLSLRKIVSLHLRTIFKIMGDSRVETPQIGFIGGNML